MAEREDDKYEVLEKIGQGSFGIIRKVRLKSTNQILCRKEISYSRMSDREKTQLHAELRILESLRHPNIVQYCHREHLKTSHDLHLYMEYCGNGDLGGYVKKLKERNLFADEEFVWTIFAQLVGALYRCHYGEDPPAVGSEGRVSKGKQPFQTKEGYRVILHRDLKPENVFLGENNNVKLGDFGLSKIIASHDFASTYVGTPFYMSPEICAAERYSHHSDIWSLGCIIYELASRCVPFDARNHVELIMKIKAGKIKPLPPQYSRELGETIGWCLKVDPRSRPDTAQLLNVLNIKLARTRIQQLEERQLALPLQQERDAALNKLSQAQMQIQELKQEVARLREAGKKVEMEWHARATLAIDQRVHEQVEARKAELMKQFEVAVDHRAEEKLGLHLASLPSSHGLGSGDSTHVRSCTPPPGNRAALSFATTGTTGFNTDAASTSSGLNSLDNSALDTDLTSLSIQEDPEDEVVSPLAQRAKPLKKAPRKPLGRAKTYAHCNLEMNSAASAAAAAAASPMDVHMADPSPARSQVAPMSIKGLSLSPRKNGRDRLSGAAGLRRDIFNRGNDQNLRPAVPGEAYFHAETQGSLESDDLLDDEDDLWTDSLSDSPSRPTSGLSNKSGTTTNHGDPFKALAAAQHQQQQQQQQPLPKPRTLSSRPSLSRQKTMPVHVKAPPMPSTVRPNLFSNNINTNKSPVREKENCPPPRAIPIVSASSPHRAAAASNNRPALTPSRKAPPPPTQPSASSRTTAAAANASRTLPRQHHHLHPTSPAKAAQGRTLVQLQQARSQPSLIADEMVDSSEMPTTTTTAMMGMGFPAPVPTLPPMSPAKWEVGVEGEEMPSPFLAKKGGLAVRGMVR